MRKFQQQNQQTTFLPTIFQSSSKRDLKTPQLNTSKENLQPNRARLSKIGTQTPHLILPKKSDQKDYGLLLEQLLQIKLLQSQKTDILTKPKMSKPWVAKQIDMNKETTKNNCLQFVNNPQKHNALLRRKSCQNQRENSQICMQKTLTKSKIDEIENSNIAKTTTKRNISVAREKIYSCRIALKNCVFPIDQKKYQQAKLADYFEKDQLISTINKKEESDQQDLFISYESLVSMNI